MDEVPERIHRKQVRRKIDNYVDYIQSRIAKYPELAAERIYREIAQLVSLIKRLGATLIIQ